MKSTLFCRNQVVLETSGVSMKLVNYAEEGTYLSLYVGLGRIFEKLAKSDDTFQK